jgi:hypothetical protein
MQHPKCKKHIGNVYSVVCGKIVITGETGRKTLPGYGTINHARLVGA